jgi:predicted RNase H-like nuclease
VRFLGVDLAWAERNPSGVAVLAGARFPLRLVAGPGTLPTHAATLDWLAGCLDRPGRQLATAIGIDAPLLGLAGGRRPCDDEVSRLFGRFHASTHSPPRAPDLARFTAHLRRRYGARSFAPGVRPTCGRPAIREVYPNALQVLLFDLERRGGTIVPYKRRRFRRKRAWVTRGLRPFIGRCRRVLEAAYVDWSAPGWQTLVARRPRVTMTAAELKAIEDRWDAVLCAVAVALEHLAPDTMRAYAGGRAGWRGGYILAPTLMPHRRELAKLASVPRGLGACQPAGRGGAPGGSRSPGP